MQSKINFNKKSRPIPQNYQYGLFGQENSEPENGFTKMLIQSRSDSLRALVNDFDNNDHKLEHVTTKNGIEIINDSHAINTNRLWFSLESLNKPLTWITSINSIDEIDDSLRELIEKKVKRVVALSIFSLDVLAMFESMGKQIIVSDNMEEAVMKAFYASEAGDAILYSPGVKSEGQYANFKERGNKFKEAVAQL